MLDIVTRAEWGAAPPKRSPVTVDWMPGGPLWVHYSDGPPPANSLLEEMRTVRAIQSFHQNTRGWNDIGYAYLVAPSGRIFEGRGFEVLGAHAPGHNKEPSVCIMWKSAVELPPQAALDSVLKVKAHVGAGRLMGHREATSTSCPGDVIFSWVQSHRTATTMGTRFDPPWQVFVGDTQIGAGKLTDPALVMRMSAALHKAGHFAPYIARVNGAVIASGKFWGLLGPSGDFIRPISSQLRAGHDVLVDNTVLITPQKG